MGRIHIYLIALKHVTLVVLGVTVIISAIHFPYDIDAPLTQQEIEAARKYYTAAYEKPVTETQVKSEYETEYIRAAEAAARAFRIEEQVGVFVKRFNLSDRPVLEIGSGRGYLQDVAQNYTGLDISPAVARFYHRKFVLGSATAMPFPDNSFDGVWSIWVFESLTRSRRFMRLDVSHETMEYFSYFRPGIVRLGLARVTKLDPIPISI
jgi:cyclopropane fatty-acyl-phospholipid synthase-like methyltransferase